MAGLVNEHPALWPFIAVLILSFLSAFVNMFIFNMNMDFVKKEIENKYDGRYGKGMSYPVITSEYEVDMYFKKGSESREIAMRGVRAFRRFIKSFLILILTFVFTIVLRSFLVLFSLNIEL